MRVYRKIYSCFFVFSIILASLMAAGCYGEKGKGFLGVWKQEGDYKYPSTLSIKYDGGVYHVDFRYFDESVAKEKFNKEVSDYFDGNSNQMPSREKSYGEDSYRIKKIEAVAISDLVLKGDGFSLRLENDKIMLNEKVYEKVKG